MIMTSSRFLIPGQHGESHLGVAQHRSPNRGGDALPRGEEGITESPPTGTASSTTAGRLL